MKLTIIGGGSVRTPRLIPSLVKRAKALQLEEVWLMDIDKDKLDLIGGLCRTMAAEQGATFKLILTTDARAAIKDATAVITSIRPGDELGRAMDERIAMKHGVLGQETTGAAGFAMAMRSMPAILDYARLVEEIAAPGAWIYNFTNPAGLVAQGLTYAGIKRVVGICDSANGAQHAVSRFMQIPMSRVRHSVYGLNHLSWTQQRAHRPGCGRQRRRGSAARPAPRRTVHPVNPHGDVRAGADRLGAGIPERVPALLLSPR